MKHRYSRTLHTLNGWSFQGREQISAAGSGVWGKWRASAVPTITQPSRANYWAGSRAEQPTDPDNPDICAEAEFEKICRRNRQERARGFQRAEAVYIPGMDEKAKGGVRSCDREGGLDSSIHKCWNRSHFSLKMRVNGTMAGQFTNPVRKQCRHLLRWSVAASVKW